jgi:hypothetical protein
VFLYTLSAVAYKEIKKTGEFVLPGFGKLVKQRRAHMGFNPKTENQDYVLYRHLRAASARPVRVLSSWHIAG